MTLSSILTSGSLVLSVFCITPAIADPGRGNGGKGNAQQMRSEAVRGDRGNHGARLRYVSDCPPGLAKKNPRCVPPGQARKHDVRYGTRIGDVLRIGDYVVVRNPRRYDLDTRSSWDYYRDDSRIYRVDSDTRKVLAVLNLIEVFGN